MADPVWHKTSYIEAFGTDPRIEPRLSEAERDKIRDDFSQQLTEEALTWLLHNCDAAIGDYCKQSRQVDYCATNKSKLATALALEKKCLDLAEYLRNAWVISDDLTRESEKEGHIAPSRGGLEIDLEKFADLCSAASTRSAARDMSGIKQVKPEHAAASSLAWSYNKITGREPTPDKPKGSKGSQFYRLLKVVLTRCKNGRRLTEDQVEYAAKMGISLWRAGRVFRNTGLPDLHETDLDFNRK